MGAGMVAVAAILPALPIGGPPCVLRALTGIPCPLCGMTTGVVATVHGHWLDAFAANPAAPLLVMAVVVAWVAWVFGRRLPRIPAISGPAVVLPLGLLWLFELARFGKL
jgi:hypothetical protein